LPIGDDQQTESIHWIVTEDTAVNDC